VGGQKGEHVDDLGWVWFKPASRQYFIRGAISTPAAPTEAPRDPGRRKRMTSVGHDTLKTRKTLSAGGQTYHYFSLPEAAKTLGDISRLPEGAARKRAAVRGWA
jgi:hypothetical protein